MDSDQPKINEKDDRFQRYDFAKRIARIIDNHDLVKSLVIGIYGKWGEGKTSVMNFIKQELSDEIVTINFNPWLFNSQEQLIKSFLNSIAYELDQSLSSNKEKVGKILSDYGDALGTMTKLVGVSLESLKTIGDRLQEVSIEKLKDRVDDMICSTGKKIVVCVDDIDRLDVKEIQYIFKLVKLVGDFPGTTYILAFDDEMIATALAPQYGDQHKKNGYMFLEKIIQLPLKIPKATKPALKKYTIDMLDQVLKELKISITQDEVNKFRSVFDEYFLPQIENPRLTTRYANAIYFSLPLLYREVSTADLMLIEGLKVLFPEAYEFTRHNSALLLADTTRDSGALSRTKTKDQIVKETNDFLDGLQKKNREAVKFIWQKLFPQYNYTVSNRSYREDKWRDWYKEKRICSPAYFERYFTYVVQTHEISDVQFEQFLSDLETLSLEDAEEKMLVFFNANQVSDIVFKLRLWEDTLTPQQSKNLSLALAKRSGNLPVESGELSAFTTKAEGAKIMAQMIANIPAVERLDHVKNLVLNASSFGFSMEIAYWLMYKNEREELIERIEQDELKAFFVEQFKTLYNGHNFFELLPDSEAWRLLSWWKESDPQGQKATIESLLKNNTANVINLIKVFTPTVTSYGGEGSKTYKSNFNLDNYNALASVVNIDLVYTVLKNDSSLKRKDYDLSTISDRDPLSDDDLISIFMQFYEQNNS